MCILSVKRNTDSVDLVFARDEQKCRKYLDYGCYWQGSHKVYGYLDQEKGGTWLANNESLFACILNQECHYKNEAISTRGRIITDLLSECDSISIIRSYCASYNFAAFMPFNLIIIDKKTNVICIRNSYSNGVTSCVISDINLPFFMVNRSSINDFSQRRISDNYSTMNSYLGRGVLNNSLLCDYLLNNESFCETENDEKTIKLNARDWKTQVISLVHINSLSIDVKTLYSSLKDS